MDNSYKNLLLGFFEKSQSLDLRTIKIFLSSTFSDMKNERDIILKHIYPELRLYCRQQYGIEFQISDMRWGVPDTTGLDHRGAEICYRELRHCQRISRGINFITIVGNRYGTINLPYTIESSEFEKIIDVLNGINVDTSVIREWYTCDHNNCPPIYSLRHIPFDKEDPSDMEIRGARQIFSDIERTLSDNIRKAIDILYSRGQISLMVKKKFCSSVTEQEIEQGLCNKPRIENDSTAAAFIRDITDIGSALENNDINKFIDVQKVFCHEKNVEIVKINESIKTLMDDIKNVTIKECLSDTNIQYFETSWADMVNGIDGVYIHKFRTDFHNIVKNIIDKNMIDKGFQSDDLYNEVLHHSVSCWKNVKHFQGRLELLNEVKHYIQGTSNVPLIVFGESGSGKTSLLAKSAILSRSWIDEYDSSNAVILLRFLGTSLGTSNIRQTLRYLYRQLLFLSGEKDSISKNDDFQLVKDTFYETLKNSSESKKIIIYLDSIDQLQPSDRAFTMSWLVTPLPKNVKMVISISSQCEDIMKESRLRFGEVSYFLQVRPLEPSICMDILESFLSNKQRTISNEQRAIIIEAFNACSLPLYVQLVYRTVLKWRSYSASNDLCLALKHTVKEAIYHFFQNLEHTFGKIFVRHSMAYITASRHGISELELEDLLSLDDEVLQSIFKHHIPPYIRIPPFLWSMLRQDIGTYLVDREADHNRVLYWYHRQFKVVADEYLFADNDTFKIYIHGIMSDYFIGTYSNGRTKRFYYPPYMVKKMKLPKYSEEERNVPSQPLIYNQTSYTNLRYSVNQFNSRKISELPWHLVNSGRLNDFADLVAFNYCFVLVKLIETSRSDFLEDLSLLNNQIVPYQKSLILLYNAIRMSHLSISEDPFNVSFDLISRLSKYDNESHPRIMDLLEQCRKHCYEHIGLIPTGQCLESGSGLLHCWHDIGMSMAIVLPNNQIMVASMRETIITYLDIDLKIIKTVETDVNVAMALKLLMIRPLSSGQTTATFVLIKSDTLFSEAFLEGQSMKMIYEFNIFSGRLTEVKELDANISLDLIVDISEKYIQMFRKKEMAKLYNFRESHYVYELGKGVINAGISQDQTFASVIYKTESHEYFDIINLQNEEITKMGIPSCFTAHFCLCLHNNVVITILRREDKVFFFRYKYVGGVLKQIKEPIVTTLTHKLKSVQSLSFHNSNVIVFLIKIDRNIDERLTVHGFVYKSKTDSVLPLVTGISQEKFRKHCRDYGGSASGQISEDEELLILNGNKCLLMTWSLKDGNLLQVITLGAAQGIICGTFTGIDKVALCHYADERAGRYEERMIFLLKLYNIEELKKPMTIPESLMTDEMEILEDNEVIQTGVFGLREIFSDALDGLLLADDNCNTLLIDCITNRTIKFGHANGPFLNITLLETHVDLYSIIFNVDNVDTGYTETILHNKIDRSFDKIGPYLLDSTVMERINPPEYFIKMTKTVFAFTKLINNWIISFENVYTDTFSRLILVKGFNTENHSKTSVYITWNVETFCEEYNESVHDEFRIHDLELQSISLRSNHRNQIVLLYTSSDRGIYTVLRYDENRTVLWSGAIIIIEISIESKETFEYVLKHSLVSFTVADIGKGLVLLKDGLFGINYKLEKINITTGEVVGRVGELEMNTYIVYPLLIDNGCFLLGSKWCGPVRLVIKRISDKGDYPPEFMSQPSRNVLLFDLTSGRLVANYPFENSTETIIVSRNRKFFSVITVNKTICCIKLNLEETYDKFIFGP